MPVVPAEPVVARQAAGSLRRLGVDSLDLYYAHWPNPFVSARRTMQALRPLLAEGVVRRVGVSNYGLGRWQEAERALQAPVIANQVRFSLVSTGPMLDLVPYAAAMDRIVVAYSPLGQGLLQMGSPSRPRVRVACAGRAPSSAPGTRRRLIPLAVVLHEIAYAHGATPAQIALAWVIRHPNTIAIPGARTIEQLEENAAAADLALTDDEFARLSDAAAAFAEGSRA